MNKTKKNKIVLTLFTLFIFVVSCSNNTIKKETETIIIKEIHQKILVKESNLGEIPIDKPIIKKDYKLINQTNETLYINYALTSCGCTIGEFETEEGEKSETFSKRPGVKADIEIKPGKFALAHITIDTTGEETGENLKLLNIFNDYNEIMIEIEIVYFLTD